MGTEKRERQKANRAQKQQEQVRDERTRILKRKIIRIAALVLLALAGVVAIAWAGGAFDGDPQTAVVDDGATTPVVDGDTDAVDDTTTVPARVTPTDCPPVEGAAEQRREFSSPPPMCIDPEINYTAQITTNFGEMTVELDAERAPMTVNNFVVLARYRYFDDTVCHRIIPDFVIQCGDPTATGTGGPGYRFDDELPEAGEYQVGSLAMANSGPDTNGSQFFIITGSAGMALPPAYSLFGQVTEGVEMTVPAIDAVGNPDPAAGGVPPLEEVRIAQVRIIES